MASTIRSLTALLVILLVIGLLPASGPGLAGSPDTHSDSPPQPAPRQGPPPLPPPPAAAREGDAPPPAIAGSPARANPAPQHPVGPFGGAADYDSGWVDVAPGGTRVLRHDLGGDPDDYVVDLTGMAVGFITQAPFSQEGFGGDTFWDGQKLVQQGYAWHSMDSSQIKVTLGANDEMTGPLRVRIWRVPGADYDSGWQAIPPELVTWLKHGLGANPDEVVVYLEYRDDDGPWGVNRMAYGHDEYWPNGQAPSEQVGAAWLELDDSEIAVFRGRDDPYADRSRVRIWRVPQADYDSGWQEIGPGDFQVFDHDLGGPWNDYHVDVQFWDAASKMAHNRFYGLDRAKPQAGQDAQAQGASLRYLLASSLSIHCGEGEFAFVHGVRVRIWANPAPKYDSGWVSIAPDQRLTLQHGLGGNPYSYHVDLEFRDTDADGDCCHGINQWALGGDQWLNPDESLHAIGAYWGDLTASSVVVQRFPDDRKADEIRLRIWLAPPPDYGYAGPGAEGGPGWRYDHFVGGATGSYVVGVQAVQEDGLGLNALGFGRDRVTLGRTEGYQWIDLTRDEVEVVFGADSGMDYPYLRIWRHPNPDYDSGWRALALDATEVFQHDLGLDPDLYAVDMQFQGVPGGLGVNQAAYGSDALYDAHAGWATWGAMWYDLTPDHVSVWRYGDDGFAAKGRMRLWHTGGCYAVEAAVEPAGGGTVELDPPPNCGSGRGYREGSVVELTAVPGDGYAFDRWVTGTGQQFTANPQAFTVDGDAVITSRFKADGGPLMVLFDEAHAERNTLSWARAQELSETLPWQPNADWVYFGLLREALKGEFTLKRNTSERLADALLRDYQALILAAPEEGLDPAEQQAVARFVRGGGGVVYLGDCGLDPDDRDFWWNTFGLALSPGCLFSPIPDLNGDFAVTDLVELAPGVENHYNTNWGGSLRADPQAQSLAWTDADTWEDSNGSSAYERGQDETGKFLVAASYDGGCGRVAFLSDDAFQDAGFDVYDNAELMRALLFRVMGGVPCVVGGEAYLPLVRR